MLAANCVGAFARTPSADPEDLQRAVRYVLSRPSSTPYAAVFDYRLHSSVPRFHIVDRASGEIVESFVAAHGSGSDMGDDGYAERFSNVEHTFASSLGLFRVAERYRSGVPQYGTALRLIGLSSTNSNAASRHIVLHAAVYVEPAWIATFGRPGMSEGCIALSPRDRDRVLHYLDRDSLIYAYAGGRPRLAEGGVDDETR